MLLFKVNIITHVSSITFDFITKHFTTYNLIFRLISKLPFILKQIKMYFIL